MDDLVEQQRAHFNGISNQYFSARKHPNHLLLKDLIWAHFFGRNRDLAAEVKRVLEPMCGMAEGLAIVNKNLNANISYLGFDYSESMVAIARELNPGVEIEWNDVTKYRPMNELFDLIILIGGLHHVYSHTVEVLVNLRGSLRTGGYFVSFEPTHNNWLTRSARERIYHANQLFDADTEQGFEYRDLQQHFVNAGFKKVDEVYPGLLAYVLYYNPDAFPKLNIGGKFLVRTLFAFERLLWATPIARKLSFATLTVWQKS